MEHLLSFFARLFGKQPDHGRPVALYQAIVAQARTPDYYRQGAVADSVEGRFDLVTTIAALVLIRLEQDGVAMAQASARLTETFVEDMDGQLREMGIGDIVVGKHIGKMMAVLGGRISALKSAFAGTEPLSAVLLRNVYRDQMPDKAAMEYLVAEIDRLRQGLDAMPADALVAGQWLQS